MFAIRGCVKEDHCDTAGLSKKRTKGVFLHGIDCCKFTADLCTHP